MNNWKFTSATRDVVSRALENNGCESCLFAALPEGTIIEAEDPPVIPVPQTLTNYQGKVTLDAFQLYDEVEAYMTGATASRAAKFAWATGAFERQGQFVLEIATAKGLTAEQVDQMFIYGSKVE